MDGDDTEEKTERNTQFMYTTTYPTDRKVHVAAVSRWDENRLDILLCGHTFQAPTRHDEVSFQSGASCGNRLLKTFTLQPLPETFLKIYC